MRPRRLRIGFGKSDGRIFSRTHRRAVSALYGYRRAFKQRGTNVIEIKGTKYCIDQDAYNYIVCINRPKVSVRDGKESISYPQVAFYSDLAGCLRYILDAVLKSATETDEIISLKEALERINTAKEELQATLGEVMR